MSCLVKSRHSLVFANRKTLSRVVLEPRCTYRRPPSGKTCARGFWSRGTTLFFLTGKLFYGWFESPDVHIEGYLLERLVHVAFGVKAQPCLCWPENSFTGGFRAQMYISKATFQKDGCTWLLESRHNLDRKLSHGRFQSPGVSKATFRKDLCTWLLESWHNTGLPTVSHGGGFRVQMHSTDRRPHSGNTRAVGL